VHARFSPLDGHDLSAAALAIGALGAVGTGAVASGSFPAEGPIPCLFKAVLGAPCPFCGVTHSLVALGEGDLAASLAWSPLGLPVLVTAVVVLTLCARSLVHRRPVSWPRPALLAGLAVVLGAWAVQLAGGVAG